MLPHTHILSGTLVASLCTTLGIIDRPQALLLVGMTVVIDADHYLSFVIKKKQVNPIQCWNSSIKREEAAGRSVIHGLWGMALIIPILALSMLLSFKWGFAFLVAYLIHMVLDQVPGGVCPRIRFSLRGFLFRISYLEIITDLVLVFFIIFL